MNITFTYLNFMSRKITFNSIIVHWSQKKIKYAKISKKYFLIKKNTLLNKKSLEKIISIYQKG